MANSACVIVNSTPLIVLGNSGHLELLRDLFGQIIIPEAVRREVLSKEDRASRFLERKPDWIIVKEVPSASEASLLPAKLHAGEVEVILLAMHTNPSIVMIDDNAARRTAAFLGLTMTGTLGILIAAKRKGLIDRVGPYLDELRNGGFRVSDKVVSYVLSQANE